MTTKQTILESTLSADTRNQQKGENGLSGNSDAQTYLTTEEAAMYLRKSTSWLTRQPDIPYVKGVPNIYKRTDLDDWFERHKFVPEVAA